jgi:hypothetical protein
MLGEVFICRTGRDMLIYIWRSYAGQDFIMAIRRGYVEYGVVRWGKF